MRLFVDVHKDFGAFKLDVSFETESGQITGLLGASGCGKSMTLRCIAGIEKPDRGRVVLDGKVLSDSERHIDLPPQKRRVGYLFQNYALFPNMTVAQNIAVGVRDKKVRRETVARLVRTLWLEGQEQKYPRQLSGGQQQRVALARILASAPEVLLLDEPFSALDSYLKWQVELELADLLSAFPGPVIFVTHNRDEVQRLCRQVCVLDQGKSQTVMPVNQLFEAPRTLSACLLSGCKNISRARPTADGKVEALDWGVTLDPEGPLPEGLSHIGVRAHYIIPVDGPGPNRLPCKVKRVVENVFSTVVMLSTPGGSQGFSRLRIELEKGRWTALAGKDPLWLELPAKDLLLLTKDG
ncbi:sulfate/molybdate ABC transporter ATP-binding protein [Intestinimonas massiliensis (ex Afouda et al. 2020)]|uniref:sulfate/molybdate ABC transporter ATP-binding protein n=1 Tax=Intestinimonas massiliensis (ex Afouda et al. 2020) TaxID=1673721 RepID=UPI00102FDA28|nr:sulfate/molybdate ABC transporter ATP-binding protein [Intestinimonas massiliensis (ex Afouda et al. 2020)]